MYDSTVKPLKLVQMKLFVSIILLFSVLLCYPQKKANYDESKIPEYSLPDPLVMQNGKPIKNEKTWTKKRRPEIVSLFEENVYGKMPGEIS